MITFPELESAVQTLEILDHQVATQRTHCQQLESDPAITKAQLAAGYAEYHNLLLMRRVKELLFSFHLKKVTQESHGLIHQNGTPHGAEARP